MTIGIKDIVDKLEELADLHPNIEYCSYGTDYDLDSDISYPYLFINLSDGHDINYTEENKYRSIEYNFTLRIGDLVNDAISHPMGNGLDIIDNNFYYMMDIINTIAENSLGLFDDIKMLNDVSIEPFFNEDDSNVSGVECTITLRVENDRVCITPFTL